MESTTQDYLLRIAGNLMGKKMARVMFTTRRNVLLSVSPLASVCVEDDNSPSEDENSPSGPRVVDQEVVDFTAQAHMRLQSCLEFPT